jgi:acyl-[acyl-carrier-protein] desaturase
MRIAICKPNFQIDLAKWCLLFNTWWKQNRYASAFLRESGEKNKYIWTIFWFCTRIGVYTAADYVDIMQKLIDKWEIDKISGLTDEKKKHVII